MEPVPWPSAFDDPGWLWQLKWDGVRCLAAIDGQRRVCLWSRRGLPRTERWPEIADALPGAVSGRRAVLDGEVVTLRPDGRPSFHLIMRRAMHSHPSPALVRLVPAAYAVFDLLALDGLDLRDQPLEARLRLLQAHLRPGGPVHLVGTRTGGGRDFVAAVAAAGLEGAVAKRVGSRYVAGRSGDWRKVKPRRTLTALVVGYRLTAGGALRSVALAGRAGDGLVYLGDVGSGLTRQAAARLHAHLHLLGDAAPPEGAPQDGRGERRWVRPDIAACVTYAELTPDGRLRAPVLVSFAPADAADVGLP